MYLPVGWPRVLRPLSVTTPTPTPTPTPITPLYVVANRDRVLFAILSSDSIDIWFVKPCVPIIRHVRSRESIETLGENVGIEWKPDSTMICVLTSEGHICLYNVELIDGEHSAYRQFDPPTPNLRRDSAELFVKELIPPLKLVLVKEIQQWDGKLTKACCISGSELMMCTTTGHLLRYRWDGTLNRDYGLDLRRIPFCVNQQVSKAVPLAEGNVYICDMDYSPLIGGFGIALSDGRAAFLTATTLKFDPNQVQGIWAVGIEDCTCTTVNHKYRLICFGRQNSQVSIYTVDETNGGLENSHNMILSPKDFPGDPGAVKCMRWSSDGRALAVSWSLGGISIWSTFGSLLMCSLGWDYGLNQDLSKFNPLNVYSMEWCVEGYQLWMIRNTSQHSLIQLDFVKSPLSTNPCMNHQSFLYLQADDKLYINLGDVLSKKIHNNMECEDNNAKPFCNQDNSDIMDLHNDPGFSEESDLSDKQWTILPLPATYSATNWPIRYTAVDQFGMNFCVAGRTGIAHYNMPTKKWKLFGNESQEKNFVVTGGMLWWKDFIVLGCFSILESNDELRLYPRDNKLDNKFAKIVLLQAQVLLLDMLEDQLIIFGSDGQIMIFNMTKSNSGDDVDVYCIQIIDLSGLCVHPACVISVNLSDLRHETSRSSHHTLMTHNTQPAYSMIVNVSGRLFLVQREESNGDVPSECAYKCCPGTVLASCVESVWAARSSRSVDQPHLMATLWLWCGALGMRVWLPLFPRPSDSSRHSSIHGHGPGPVHTFMSKRIMLPFHLKIYPLAILFEDAIILGAENDTVLYTTDSNSVFSLPFSILNRTSQVYLHQILRQLLRRNLGYHAWEIARSCSNLPYFPHSLELLLHEVLEEEATSKEPIPDAQLPSVIEFIQEFPVYLQTVVQCARKTEIALWTYLFSAAGKPKELFQMCLHNKMLDTAASYLIILQNLESSSVSRQLATVLLDTALQYSRWNLARDLVRFLRAIDPNDVESPRTSVILGSKFSINPQTPTVSPNAEDLSVILGSMQVSRGRSFSTTVTPKISDKHNNNETSTIAAPSIANTAASQSNKRKKSVPTGKNDKEPCAESAEEFFIDVMLQRHARRLLSAGKMWHLGHFASRLDFHLVAWLATEKERAARVENAVLCLKLLHHDFHWPYPEVQPSLNNINNRKGSGTQNAASATPSPTEDASLGGDSGYMSLSMSNFPPMPLLGGKDRQDRMSVVSEVEALSLRADSERHYSASALIDHLSHQQPETGPTRSEVQLRYLLQLTTEAGCVEWAFLLAFILRDVMAIIRITNAVKSADISTDAILRLKKAFQELSKWIDSECIGYKPFMVIIQHQSLILTTILQNRDGQKQISSSTRNSISMNTNKMYQSESCTSTLERENSGEINNKVFNKCESVGSSDEQSSIVKSANHQPAPGSQDSSNCTIS